MRVTKTLRFDAAHRLVNHPGKCARLHGHTYEAEIDCEGELDPIGCVIDFGAIKETVGAWVERCWDHGTLAHREDAALLAFCQAEAAPKVYAFPSNPTAENIARELLRIARELLPGVHVARVRIRETPTCCAEVLAAEVP